MSTKNEPKETPTPEQLAALITFAVANGHSWKASLRHAWETGNYRYYLAADEPRLQQIRNNFGPTWLSKFKLSDYRKAEIA